MKIILVLILLFSFSISYSQVKFNQSDTDSVIVSIIINKKGNEDYYELPKCIVLKKEGEQDLILYNINAKGNSFKQNNCYWVLDFETNQINIDLICLCGSYKKTLNENLIKKELGVINGHTYSSLIDSFCLSIKNGDISQFKLWTNISKNKHLASKSIDIEITDNNPCEKLKKECYNLFAKSKKTSYQKVKDDYAISLNCEKNEEPYYIYLTRLNVTYYTIRVNKINYDDEKLKCDLYLFKGKIP